MRIENRMKRPVHTVKPLDSIQHARDILEQHRINQLPVVMNERVVGIITDRDLRDAFPSALAPRAPRQADPRHITVETVMSERVLTLGPKDLLVDAARLMRRERIGALPIVDGGRLVGIIARSDVLDAFVDLAPSPGQG